MTRRAGHGAWQTFRWPLALALVSIMGLMIALLGDGWEDAASWLLLGSLLATLAVALRRAT